MSVVQSVELLANDPVTFLTFCDVSMEGGLNERETRRALDPVVADLTEKARVINSVEVLLENNLMLDLLKLFPQNFNIIDLFKHFFPTDRVNSWALLANNRKRPLLSTKEFIMPQKLILFLKNYEKVTDDL